MKEPLFKGAGPAPALGPGLGDAAFLSSGKTCVIIADNKRGKKFTF